MLDSPADVMDLLVCLVFGGLSAGAILVMFVAWGFLKWLGEEI
jgi:hypothetical protein